MFESSTQMVIHLVEKSNVITDMLDSLICNITLHTQLYKHT